MCYDEGMNRIDLYESRVRELEEAIISLSADVGFRDNQWRELGYIFLDIEKYVLNYHINSDRLGIDG